MAQDEGSRIIAVVPIVEVTVQEDRALVRREGSVVVPPGRTRLRIEGVAPVLVDKSLLAEVLADEDAETRVEVRRVTATRWQVTEEAQRPVALAELREQLRTAEADAQALARRRAGVAAERQTVESLLRTTLEELSQDAGWGRTDPAHAHGTLDALQVRVAALGRERQALEAEQARLAKDLADLKRLEAATQTVQ